ncbi:MAG: hypothetical protein HND56_02980 [Pseudomonadota bacterium]|jgi:hypothetical protein|nr:hypothetical protein [Pseudomonadota bacterium]QKK04712.1 MAG: hypothetical protein HND56_02980 [Pseudomonadota bacterium]
MSSASQKFSFKKLTGNFIKAAFVAAIGGAISAAVLILGNSFQNSLEIFQHHFLWIAVVSTVLAYTGTYFVMAMADKDRSAKANKFHITFWSIGFLLSFVATCYGYYDYYKSPYRGGSEWNASRGKMGQADNFCDPKKCLKYR